MKKTGVFIMSPDIAIEYYLRVQQLGLRTEEECTKLLLQMAKEGKMDAVYTTARSKSQVGKDYKKHFNTLDLRKKEVFWTKIKSWLSSIFKRPK